MPVPSQSAAANGRLSKTLNLLRTKGVTRTCKAVFGNLWLKLEIRLRGGNKKITLDGCTFDLRGLPNTGMKLQLLTGSYEAPERSAARRHIEKDWPVIELGGCIGVVACITNKSLQTPSAHIVLEANPLVIKHLESNRQANDCSFTIVNKAIAYNSEFIALTPSPDFWGTSLYDPGGPGSQVSVPAARLDQIVADSSFEKFALICDIEGQEYNLIKNELQVLNKAEVIIMEIHPHVLGESKISEIFSELDSVGFKIVERMASVVVLSKKA